jgi:23S rRNA (uracil1939-C5)-methyltransferase
MSSPDRVDCPHASRCPGCPWIGLDRAEQLAAKRQRLASAIAGYDTLRVTALPARGAEELSGYRTRAKLVVAPGPRLGLYARASHEALDLPSCRVLTPGLAAAAAALRTLMADPPAPAAAVLLPEGEGPGQLRAVDLREAAGDAGPSVLLTLVLRAPAPDAGALAAASDALAAAIPALGSLALRLHDGRSPGLLGGPPRVLRGPALLPERPREGAPYVLVGSGSFAQVHRAQAARLEAEVERALGALAGRRVLDLYAGSGALGLALAARGARPVLVEAFAPAARAAEEAARAQGLAVEVRAAPAEGALAALRREGARFDAAVANPPRAGMTPRVREALAGVVAGPLVLVSCEPVTLARDLAHLRELGLRPERLEPWDLMPLTDQVEGVALLRRAPPPLARVLHEGSGFVAVAKPPFLPTLPHPEQRGSLLARVRALAGFERAAPLGRLDVGTSGVCLFAAAPERVAALQRALAAEQAEKRYLALVRGVARPRGRIARGLRDAGREREAATRYRRIAVVGGHALLEVSPESGRSHQIRRHLASIGEPVLGDARHGHAPSNRHLFERAGLDRPFLHCASATFRDPASGARLVIEAPLAPDLASVLARLGLDAGVLGARAAAAPVATAAAAPPA